MGEFELIHRIARRARPAESVVHGIGDDAAVLQPTAGHVLLSTTDSLVLDRHFTSAWPAADIGHLALAVNLSDLAAMAATPRWVLLSLTLPSADEGWLDGFLDGFLGLADAFETTLVGGNISSGPMNIGVQLLGEALPGQIVTRQGARPGDWLAVTGSLGDAAAALKLGQRATPGLVERLRRPVPRLTAARALATHVRAMIDVSDGLLADLGHLLGVDYGAEIELSALPASPDLAQVFPAGPERWAIQAGGGNDYELLVALAADQYENAVAACATLGLALTAIGRVSARPGIRCLDEQAQELEMSHGGWDHFGSD